MSPEDLEVNFESSQAPAQPATQPPPAWNLRDLALFFGLGAVALAIAYVLVVPGYSALAPSIGWHVPPKDNQETAFLSLVLQSVFYFLLFGAVYLLVAIRKRLPFWKAMKWRAPGTLKTLGYFALGATLSVAVQFAPILFPDRSDFPLSQLFTTPAIAYAVGGFAVLVAPLMEELVFRGVLFSIFEDQAGPIFAVIASAALFTGLHVPEYRGAWNHLFLLFFVGLVFSLARGLTGSLAPSVFLHASYNLCQLVVLYFASDHFRALQGVLTG
jgi:membrane protease YdiL (CAAX protease family)